MNRQLTKSVYGPLQEKTVKNVLIKHIINCYGYDNKLRIAETMVEDMLDIMDEFLPKQQKLKPGQLIWYAVDVNDKHTHGKKMKEAKLKPVILTLISEDDLKDYADGISVRKIRNKRMLRIFEEAYEQGGVLALSDAAVLLSVLVDAISKNLQKIRKQGIDIPTRGFVHDLGPTVTHKKQIIELYEQGYLTPDIGRMTKHDKTNVDRYIKDYERVKQLADKFDKDKISRLTGLSRSLVEQYLEIIGNQNNVEWKRMVKI